MHGCCQVSVASPGFRRPVPIVPVLHPLRLCYLLVSKTMEVLMPGINSYLFKVTRVCSSGNVVANHMNNVCTNY